MSSKVKEACDFRVSDTKKMGKYKFSPKILIGLLLAIFFIGSLILRISLPYDQVFGGDWIKFTSIDAYYHMRLVDTLVYNFPSLTHFDPFFIYPDGINVSGLHFFDWLLSGIIWVIGLGSPSQHTVDVIGAYFPAILAALVVIPVFFLAKALFNKWAGVIAAALAAVLPGEFLGRSILGFTDHHVAEILFSTTAVLFLILAIKEADQRKLTFSHLLQRDWKTVGRPLVYSLLAGIFLGLYLITWQGSLLFVFIIALYFVIQSIIDHMKRKTMDHLGIIGFILFLVALIIFMPISPVRLLPTAVVIAVLIPLVLAGVSRLISVIRLKPIFYPLSLVVIGGAFLAIYNATDPQTLGKMLSLFSIFNPAGATAATTLEMQPFLSPQGSFTTAIAWGNYTTGFYISLCLLAYLVFYKAIVRRQSSREENLFLVWSVVILIATLVQRRFAYYFVINVAILTAYASWLAIWYSGLRTLVNRREASADGVSENARSKVKKRHRESQGITIYHINTVLAIIVVCVLILSFNIVEARKTASAARFAPSDAWQESLLWMKANTPEPFDDPDAYYKLYEPPPPGEDYNYPESAYGIMSWWDYGYWITRTAHRLPITNPSQASKPITRVAKIFLSQEASLTQAIQRLKEEDVSLTENKQEIMEELESSYIIADFATATTKFWAVITWAGQEQGEYFGIYYLPYEGQLVPIQVFYPRYYQSMLIRLYNFDGEAVTDVSPTVITYEETVDRDGNRYRQISDANDFSSYQKALDYIESEGTAKHEIVGTNPFISPIPLETVQDYKLVYSSKSGMSNPDGSIQPEVKIFEYTGD